jgi:hypothetical protein
MLHLPATVAPEGDPYAGSEARRGIAGCLAV